MSITHVCSLASQAPKGNIIQVGVDLSKMKPAMITPIGGMVSFRAMGHGLSVASTGLRLFCNLKKNDTMYSYFLVLIDDPLTFEVLNLYKYFQNFRKYILPSAYFFKS